jgi:hypothetical protein
MSEDNYNNDTKHFIMYQLKWIGIYMGIGLVLAVLLPFPISFISAVAVFIVMSYYRRRKILRKYGDDSKGVKSIFGRLSSLASSEREQYYTPLKYYCMSCGKEHKEIACPGCGSKMKRVG